ncbi:restriction endonuclease [Corynebacterium hindlerae]|uniref:Restriction endonuclease n=2 Tax=Corynebacterium hindlerae TaxID=699041 RepID=A0A7G5FIJ6_9CORY|nr:restriction endonuclease [Corynebacterium hindlerae]
MTIDLFREAAGDFADTLKDLPFPELYGSSDGKAVGTRIEAMFKAFLERRYSVTTGNAAKGLDFPTINTDLKVTSLRQPQSSCPFKDAKQKIYGLGYNLMIIVYTKNDDIEQQASFFTIHNVIFVDKSRTADYTLTRQLREIIDNAEDPELAVEDIDAILQDKNVPLDETSRYQLAQQIVIDPPEQGYLTISNALQWRLQYKRVIDVATKKIVDEVLDLKHGE